MAKVVNKGYTDTPVEGVSSLTFPRAVLNFKADFRVKSNQPNEMVLTNITSPVDRAEQIRVAYSNIANIYSGTSIEPSLCAPTKRGVSLLCQVTDIISVTDNTDPDYRIDLPVSYHLVIKIPANENLTTTLIQEGLGRMVSGIFETGSTALTRLEALIRGSLVPSDL
jgi:hypothetical protein